MSDGEIMTKDEIYEAFDSEWVLLDEIEANEFNEILRAKVIYHSKSRDEISVQIRSRPTLRRFAVLYTGKPPEDMEYAL